MCCVGVVGVVRGGGPLRVWRAWCGVAGRCGRVHTRLPHVRACGLLAIPASCRLRVQPIPVHGVVAWVGTRAVGVARREPHACSGRESPP